MKNRTQDRFFPCMAMSVALVAALAACAQKGSSDGGVQSGQIIGGGTVQMKEVQAVGAFLPDPSLLLAGESGGAAFAYRNPSVKFSSYDKVLLDPVTVWAAPDSQWSTVPPPQRQALAD